MSKLKNQTLKQKALTALKKAESVLLFLTLLFLPTQLGKHFWPEFSYIYSLKIDYLSPAIYFWDILAAGLLTVWLMQKPRICKPALSLLLLFLLTQVLSLPGAENLGAGLARLEQYFLAGLFGVFIASRDFKSLRMIYLPLSLGVLGVSAMAALQVIYGSTLGFWVLGERTFDITTPGIAKFDFYGMQFLRPYAAFPHPNVLAGYLLVLVYGLWFMVYGKRRLLGIVSVIAAMVVFLTMSRTAILAGFITLTFFLRRKWLMLMILIFLVVSPVLFARFSSLLNYDNLAYLRRQELIGNSLQIFLKNPVFGAGLNNFIPEMAGGLVAGPSRFLQPVHNIVFLELAETGIIGLFGLLCLIGVPILRIFKLYPLPFTLYPILPWLIIIFLGMFDHYFLTLPQGYRLLFLVWGLSLSVKMTR